MIIKWITCRVEPELKQIFSEAQEKWVELSDVEGFLGQIGGWGCKDPHLAGILSFWENSEAYKHFMKEYHDSIYERSKQRFTFTDISVRIYERLFDLNPADLTESVGMGSYLRIADCQVTKEKRAAFEQEQQAIWNPGRAECGGMKAGVFAKDLDRYLTVSLWKDEAAHQYYVEKKLPSLLQNSSVNDPGIKSWGSGFVLDPNWAVRSEIKGIGR